MDISVLLNKLLSPSVLCNLMDLCLLFSIVCLAGYAIETWKKLISEKLYSASESTQKCRQNMFPCALCCETF